MLNSASTFNVLTKAHPNKLMLKILITSVGSLVGQNILDSLEGRREGVRVIGVNSLAEAASNLTDFPVRHEAAAMLKEHGVWRRP